MTKNFLSTFLAVLLIAGCQDNPAGNNLESVDSGTNDSDAGNEPDADAGQDADVDDRSLEIGEVRDIEPGEDGMHATELKTGVDNERYVLQLVSLSRQPIEVYDYEVSINGKVMGQPQDVGPVPETVLPDWSIHPFWDVAVKAAGEGEIQPPSTKGNPPDVGEMVPFTIQGDSGYVEIQCEVVFVDDEIVVFFDRTTEPELSIDTDILNQVAKNFASIVLPRERQYFGMESDVNDDGHISMLFSPLVFTATGGATAYVFPCDLLPTGAAGCPASNEQEIIYISPPDLLSSYMGTSDAITETIAHEFQHAIYFYRKVMLNDIPNDNESMYITEGMSAMAQDLTGFQSGNRYVAGAAIDGIDDVSLADVLAYPFGYDEKNDGVYRGAAYLLLRYAFEQLGGDAINDEGKIEDLGGLTFTKTMTNLASFGYEGFEEAAQEDCDMLLPDFYTALLLDDREKDGVPINLNTRYEFAPMWDDPITGKPHGVTLNYDLAGGTWPVRGVPLQHGGADASIKSGGAEYIMVDVPPVSEETEIVVEASLDTEMVVRLIRIY